MTRYVIYILYYSLLLIIVLDYLSFEHSVIELRHQNITIILFSLIQGTYLLCYICVNAFSYYLY